MVVDAKNVLSHCMVTFSKMGCGTVWTGRLLKHIFWYTLITHTKMVVDAKIVFSHSTVAFSKIGCEAVWTELLHTRQKFAPTNDGKIDTPFCHA